MGQQRRTMPPETLLAEMERRGFNITLSGEYLEIYPADKLTEQLLRVIDRMKWQLIEVLERDPPHSNCDECGSTAFAHNGEDRDWTCLHCGDMPLHEIKTTAYVDDDDDEAWGEGWEPVDG